MRPLAFALTLTLALAACGKQEAAGDSGALEQALARDDLETNDLTAIDAASAHDARMAADIDPAEFANAEGGAVVEQIGGEEPRPRPRSGPSVRRTEPASDSNSSAPAPAPASEQPAATNTTG